MNRNLEPYNDNYSYSSVRTGELSITVYNDCALYNIIDRGTVIMDTKYQLPHFKYVSGTFICNHIELYSLTGSPRYVGGDFICQDNHIGTIDGCPLYVGRIFRGWDFNTPPEDKGTIIINNINYNY